MSVIKEYRTVSEVVGPLMIVDQVEGVHYNELVEIKLHDGTTRQGSIWKKLKSALPDVP